MREHRAETKTREVRTWSVASGVRPRRRTTPGRPGRRHSGARDAPSGSSAEPHNTQHSVSRESSVEIADRPYAPTLRLRGRASSARLRFPLFFCGAVPGTCRAPCRCGLELAVESSRRCGSLPLSALSTLRIATSRARHVRRRVPRRAPHRAPHRAPSAERRAPLPSRVQWGPVGSSGGRRPVCPRSSRRADGARTLSRE